MVDFNFILELIVMFVIYLWFPILCGGLTYFFTRKSKRKWIYSIMVSVVVFLFEAVIMSLLIV